MDRVLIVCGAGASSTFLALRVRRALRERDLDLVVEAGTVADVGERLAATRILLVGPHLAEQFGALAGEAAAAGAEAGLLPGTVYGPDGGELAADIVTELLAARGSSRPNAQG